MKKNSGPIASKTGARAVSGNRTLSVERSPLAWELRPSHVETLTERRQTATRTKPLEVERYDDATVFDTMLSRGWITPRQHRAAEIVHGWAYAAGLLSHILGGLEMVREEVVDVFDPLPEPIARDPEAPGPSDRYRRLMRELGLFHSGLVERIVFGQTVHRQWFASLGAALDRAADMLGLR